MTSAGRDGWWFRLLNGLLADALAYRRVRRLTTRDYLIARERVGKDEGIRGRAAQVGLATIDRHLGAERDRRRSIEEKARANLAAITLALTIVVAGPTSLVAQLGMPKGLGEVQLPTAGILLIAALYFLWSGHMALRALLLREWWQIVPDEELWDEAKRAEHTWWYVLMNQKVTIEKTNALDVSYTAMQCGMATLVLLLLTVGILVGVRQAQPQRVVREPYPSTLPALSASTTRRGGDDAMRLFPGSSWTDLATAAVACVSVAGVWWTFWPGHRERLRERREQRLNRLLGLHVQLQHIGHWASTSYDPDVHRAEWYNASWRVNPFPWDYVENFNRLVVARDYPRSLTEALGILEAAARRFHDMLAEQAEFLARAPKDINLRLPAAVTAAEAKGAELSAEDLENLLDLTDANRAWLAELYRRNKATHVEGIGSASTAGLHVAWSVATARLHEARGILQAGRDSRWRWVGHVLAGVFAGLALLFLTDFGWSTFTRYTLSRTRNAVERAGSADSSMIEPHSDTNPAASTTTPSR